MLFMAFPAVTTSIPMCLFMSTKSSEEDVFIVISKCISSLVHVSRLCKYNLLESLLSSSTGSLKVSVRTLLQTYY